MTEPLDKEANTFASTLTGMLGACIRTAPTFAVVAVDDASRKIGPGPFRLVDGRQSSPGFEMIPLVRSGDPTGEPRLLLKVEFDVALDPDEQQHLTVIRSTFGLWVRPDPTRSARPVLRIEYDRDARRKPPAHVHIHAESVELGWIYGTAGVPLTRLQEIHFPVGGRRFRPTIEELLLFLDREHLFDDWATPDWRNTVEQSLRDWESRQARATVRRHRAEAIEELERPGYRIEPSGSA